MFDKEIKVKDYFFHIYFQIKYSDKNKLRQNLFALVIADVEIPKSTISCL